MAQKKGLHSESLDDRLGLGIFRNGHPSYVSLLQRRQVFHLHLSKKIEDASVSELAQCQYLIHIIYIIKIKLHSSCEIEDFVETHLCKLCVILRPIYVNATACLKTTNTFPHTPDTEETRPEDCSVYRRSETGYRAAHFIFTTAPHST